MAERVILVDVDETVLDELVEAATADASADDVTPPLTPGDEWTPARIDWLRQFHRDRRGGLDGPVGEITWAVRVAGELVGSVRLRRTNEPGVLDTGVWLTRRTRGRGVGTLALSEVLSRALTLGARGVRADTTSDNLAAMTVLRRLGFDLHDEGDGVRAVFPVEAHADGSAHRAQPDPDASSGRGRRTRR